MSQFDLVVIGTGAGGLIVAAEAKKEGCNAPQILDTRLSEIMMPKRRVEHGSSSQVYP